MGLTLRFAPGRVRAGSGDDGDRGVGLSAKFLPRLAKPRPEADGEKPRDRSGARNLFAKDGSPTPDMGVDRFSDPKRWRFVGQRTKVPRSSGDGGRVGQLASSGARRHRGVSRPERHMRSVKRLSKVPKALKRA